MSTAPQPDLLAAMRLVRDLRAAESAAAVRGAVLSDLPRSIRCDVLVWATHERTAAASPPGDDSDRHVARVDLPHDGYLTGLALHRGRGRFTDAERALLELLRPHLLSAVQRVDHTERLTAAHLTPRERAVLALVADGATNQAIARVLQMSPRTVEKHLEHAYGKLGVCSRTAAVAAVRTITH
jgi:DNA-binding NarL/FixJ family response regulator